MMGEDLLRLLLIRHGETDWNAGGRFQGQLDIELNEEGRRQAQALAARLAPEPLDVVYTSDLARARDTAQHIIDRQRASGEQNALDLRPDPRLRELNLGDWQGLTYAQIEAQDPERLAAWDADRVNYRLPGGESLRQVADRVRAVLDDVRQGNGADDGPENQTIALVTHGLTLRILLCLLLSHPLSGYWQFSAYNTSVTEVLLRDAGAVLVRLNDTHHLKPHSGRARTLPV